MSANFTKLAHNYFVAPQLSVEDVQRAAAEGFRLIVNNRPDDEMIGQPESTEIEAAAREAGMKYAFIPVGSSGLTRDHIEALKRALDGAEGGKALGFCKSGARSAFLYAYAAAMAGRKVSDIVAEAADAGFDIGAHAPVLERLSQEARNDDE